VRSQGHWICIKGAKICDTHTGGRWVFGADGPHRGARIMEVYKVARSDGVAGTLPASGLGHEHRALAMFSARIAA
jgi:hypothetical protein